MAELTTQQPISLERLSIKLTKELLRWDARVSACGNEALQVLYAFTATECLERLPIMHGKDEMSAYRAAREVERELTCFSNLYDAAMNGQPPTFEEALQ